MTRLTNPAPLFLDARGALLDAGHIYIGAANTDPQAQPIVVFWDAGLTLVATQPLRTSGGAIVRDATPAQVFMAEPDYAMRVTDADDNLVRYEPTSFPMGSGYQPLDSDLTAIAALVTTPFGRALLQLASQGDLKDATGIPDPLPLVGGQMTGNITRQSAGVHTYWANPAVTGGRLYLTVDTASDPTSQPGDVWLKYKP